MGQTDDDLSAGENAFDTALGEYLRRLDAGEKVDRGAFAASHPDVAADLRAYFATADVLERIGGPTTDADSHSTLSIDTARGLGAQETVPPNQPHPSERGPHVPVEKADDGPGSGGQAFGRYRLVRVLGQGAMGVVHLALDTELDRQVALKVPKFTQADAPELIERFYREARSAAALNHRNICPLFDIGEVDGMRYITMAYIDGRPLSDFIGADKPLPLRQIAGTVRKLAVALAVAHGRGVIHRDLKPANILIDRSKEPVIMDFGLARQINKPEDVRITQSGALVGSPAYMSPEQVEGHLDAIGPHSDIYSLGVILYELLTGQLPFQGSIASVIGQIISVEPKKPSARRADVDGQLESICLKMMSKKIDDRYASMQEVAEALTAYLKDPQSGADPRVSVERLDLPAVEIAQPVSNAAKSLRAASGARKQATQEEYEALYRTAKKCVRAHDYEQAVGILNQVPDDRLTNEMQRLRDKAQELQDEVDLLLADIEDTSHRRNQEGLQEKVERLLQLKPGHEYVRQMQAKLAARSHREPRTVRLKLGPLGNFRVPAWAARTAIACLGGLLLYGVVTLFFRVGNEAVKVEIDPQILAQENVTISFNEEDGIEIRNLGDTIRVTPGQNTYIVRSGDRKITGGIFTVVRGDNPVLTIKPDRTDSPSPAAPKTQQARVTPADPPVAVKSAAVAGAEDDQTATAPPSSPAANNDGWIALFNGRDLSGWKFHPSQSGNWRVENGILVGRSKPLSHLFTDRGDWSDFHLRAELRTNADGNSGIFIRSPFNVDLNKKYPYGYEAQVRKLKPGQMPPNHTGTFIVHTRESPSLVAPMTLADPGVRSGEWFTCEIIARGKRFIVKVNGKTTADYEDAGAGIAQGHVALQIDDTSSVAEYRKIEIQELNPSATRETSRTPAPSPVPDTSRRPPLDKPAQTPGPLVFKSLLSTPDTLDMFYLAYSQYGGKPVVEAGNGLRLGFGHTAPMVWAKPYLGDKYLVQFEVQLKENGWAGWTLSGPGYGNSFDAGYGCYLEKSRFSFRRDGVEVQSVELPAPIVPGEWTNVQADVSGGKFGVMLNGVPVARFTDPDPLTGPLHGWFGISAGESAFRNLSIWSSERETNRERQLTPPVTEKPVANGKLLYEGKLQFPPNSKTRDLGPEWWKSQPDFAAIDKGTLVLSGPNGTPAIVLNKPLGPELACEVEFEYPNDEAVNFAIMLWHAEKAPQSAKDGQGWNVELPVGNGNMIARWHTEPVDGWGGFESRSPILASTGYYAPISRRKYLARIETQGDELRLFMDGGLVLKAKRPEGAAVPAMPVFLALRQFLGGSKVHAVRVYQIAGEVAANGKREELQKTRTEAEAARAEIARLQTATSQSKAGTGQDADAISARQRRAAEWVLQNGGAVTLQDGSSVQDAKPLPTGLLQIVEIKFPEKSKSVDDQGLALLAGLKSLQRLSLRGSSITDAGLVHLKDLPLQALNLHATNVSNAGLANIAGMVELTRLDLGYNRKISDIGAAHLRNLTKLQKLNIYATNIGDEGLKSLEGMKQLEDLELHGSRITDAGLVHLKQLTGLKILVLPKGLKEAEVDALRATHPNCRISTD